MIENVWGMLDGKRLGSRATTNDSWRKRIESTWDGTSWSSINKLVTSVPKRVKVVAQNGGEWLKGGKWPLLVDHACACMWTHADIAQQRYTLTDTLVHAH